jgi:transcriptional regulator of heat shock response
MEDKQVKDVDPIKIAEEHGRKLAVLIASSNLPEQVKDELVVLLEEMSLSQIEELLNVFESRFLDEKTKDIDEEYKKKVENVIKEYKETGEKEAQKVIDQLKHI